MNDQKINAQVLQGLHQLAQFVTDPNGRDLLAQIIQLQQQDVQMGQQEEQSQTQGQGGDIMSMLRQGR